MLMRIRFQAPSKKSKGIRVYRLSTRNQEVGACASKLAGSRKEREILYALTYVRILGIEPIQVITRRLPSYYHNAEVSIGGVTVAMLAQVDNRPERYSLENQYGEEMGCIVQEGRSVHAKAFRLMLARAESTMVHEFRIALCGTGLREAFAPSAKYYTIWGKGEVPVLNPIDTAAIIAVNAVFRTVLHPLDFKTMD